MVCSLARVGLESSSVLLNQILVGATLFIHKTYDEVFQWSILDRIWPVFSYIGTGDAVLRRLNLNMLFKIVRNLGQANHCR